MEYKADIIMVQETHLKPKNSKTCKIKNFTLLRTDRQGAPMGGTAIYYNRALYCCPMDIPPLTNIEATACRLSMIGHGVLTLYDIDNAIGALTSHITTVVENSSRKVPAKSDRKELPRDVIELIRDKNAALRRAGKYPTRENRSRARALQRRVKARIKEIKNDNWSDLMAEISPSHKAYWRLAKALKTEGAAPTPALKRPDNSIAFDDREKAECLADSIEHQCSENPPYDAEHVRRVEEEFVRVSSHPKTVGTPSAVKRLNAFLRPCGSIGRNFNACIQNCYFPTAWKEAVVIGIPKPGKPRDLPASYRPISLLSVLVRPIRAGVPQGSTLSPLLYSAYVNDIPRPSSGVQLALFADDTALYLRSNCLRNILPRLQRAIDELTQWLRLWRIEVNPEKPVMTYASPVFAHARPDILYDLQIVQNKFCRRAADAPWSRDSPPITTLKVTKPVRSSASRCHFGSCSPLQLHVTSMPRCLVKTPIGSHAPTASPCRNGRVQM
ncbi:Probable RNA-directed DNA polymerase from transposon BS [Eumeta japonica]|uniref:Probable RNA-directed DNA polymerase from transposon BS n=1 Tax=Eumeta variegata TaxID=151549 RepID=A0A4C1UIN8_EUMVA|nr:Probable RNA-directed DNA polymerase from transposon BS [Eumeta japonica]